MITSERLTQGAGKVAGATIAEKAKPLLISFEERWEVLSRYLEHADSNVRVIDRPTRDRNLKP